MKILITGACGFVGSKLAEHFLGARENLSLYGIDNLSRKGSKSNIEKLQKLGVKFSQGDIRYSDDLNKIGPVDWVVDCAANPSVLAGFNQDSGPEEVVDHNLIGTLRVLEYCRKHKAGLILLSTSRVYSTEHLNKLSFKTVGNRFQPEPGKFQVAGFGPQGVSESFPVNPPLSLYGATKLASEVMALEYGSAFSFPVWINRSSVLAGAGQFGKVDQGILSYWIYQYILDRPLTFIGYGGKGLQVRDFYHPMDLGPVFLKQIDEPFKTSKPRIVNFGGGLAGSISLAELSMWCDERAGKKKPIASKVENRAFDVPYYVTDAKLASEVWGWRPKQSLEEILEETWQWAAANRALIESFS